VNTEESNIPCGDQLREAWLDAVELHGIVTDILESLDSASKLANDEKPDAKLEAKRAKEHLHRLTVKAAYLRDMVTIWQAWASGSSID
jgi:hypothetical protein